MSLMKFASLLLAFLQTVTLAVFKKPLTQTIFIDSSVTHQAFEGFGTSACWWAQSVSDEAAAREIAKALYDKNEGLGLSVYRYNIGAGEKDNPASRIGDINRRTESFYYFNEAAGEYEYDFTRDASARRMLDYAVEYGADKIILFCNSPHFSMTLSGQASGGLSDSVSNLPDANYDAFVDYVLTIADWFVAEGYPVAAISPINEPQWGWGGGWVGQEGCHYTPGETVKVLEKFAVEMQRRGSEYELRGPESGQMCEAQNAYLDAFFASDILNNFCDTFSGHAYWMDDNNEGKKAQGDYFAEKYPDKKYEMSEWCELPLTLDSTTIESGLKMANVMISDFNLMNAVSWQSWTALNGDGVLDYGENGIVHYSRYYAYKQFSSFIREGMKRIEIYDSRKNSSIASTAFTDGEKTVVVLINNSDEETSVKLRGICGKAEIYTTDALHSCEKTFEGILSCRADLPAKSITTVVV